MATVQNVSGTSSTTTMTGTFGSAVTSGNVIIVLVTTNNFTFSIPSSITDTPGNTYTKITSVNFSNSQISLWTAPVTTGGTSTVTVHMSGSQEGDFIAREQSGLSSATPDKFMSNGATTGTAVTSNNTATTTSANELVVGLIASSLGSQTITVGSGYGNTTTAGSTNMKVMIEDKTVAVTGAYAATATLSSSFPWGAIVGTFVLSGGGGTPTNQFFALF